MAQLITYSTSDVPADQRIQHWNNVSSAGTTALVVDPLDKSRFSARIDLADMGQLRVSDILSSPSLVRHSKQHVIASRDAHFLIALQLEGICCFRQLGIEAALRAGDFALFDSALPFDVVTRAPHRLLVLGVSHQTLKRSVWCPEAVLGRRMPGDVELSGLVSRFIRSFWSQYRDRLDSTPLPRITGAILDLLASAYSLDAPPLAASTAAVWHVRITEHIETHLDDSDLTPARIAADLHISPRYLHQLFGQDDETVARYIQNRRLERCAEALLDPTQRGRSVIDIVLSHGFKNHSHFSRIFRARYQMSPREYRHTSSPPNSFADV